MNRTMRYFMMGALLLSAVIILVAESAKAPDTAYVQSFEKWKADQTADLKENWLPLAGLFWLKPGENTFGSDTANALVFPGGPAHAGEFESERERSDTQTSARCARDDCREASQYGETGFG